jgi:Na+/melibiose symporter-like transporter
MRGITADGSNGSCMTSANSFCFEPKKWLTSVGSTPACSATERIEVRSKPCSANWARAAARIASLVPLSPVAVRSWTGRGTVRSRAHRTGLTSEFHTCRIQHVRNSEEHAVTAELSPARRRAVLAVVALALMMVVSAVSGLNVALPDLARSTGASQTQLTWIVDAYTVVFAGLLLCAGALGDRYGRKGILVAGLVVFGAAAGWAFTIDDPSLLIAARVLMGAGAAAVMPTTLSVITTSFPPEERGRAVSVWVGVAGGGAVIGLFGSGILLEFFSWNSFFALNVTLAVLALIGTVALIPTSRETRRAGSTSPVRCCPWSAWPAWCSRSSRAPTAAGPRPRRSPPAPSRW